MSETIDWIIWQNNFIYFPLNTNRCNLRKHPSWLNPARVFALFVYGFTFTLNGLYFGSTSYILLLYPDKRAREDTSA